MDNSCLHIALHLGQLRLFAELSPLTDDFVIYQLRVFFFLVTKLMFSSLGLKHMLFEVHAHFALVECHIAIENVV